MFSAVNKKLLPMKGHYFFYNAATAPVIPFLPVLARQLGFSSTIVGVIYTVLPICGMLAKPLMGALADRFRIKKILFIIFQIITAFALLPINFIPKLPTINKTHFSCDGGAAVLDLRPNKANGIPDNILNQLVKEKGSNGTFTCQVDCQLESSDLNTIQNFWPSLRNTHIDETFSFLTTLNVSKTDVIENILYFPVHDVMVDDVSSKALCPNKTYSISRICDISCNSKTISDFLLETAKDYTVADVVGYYQFWLFFLLAIFAWVGMAVVVSVGDAICFEILGDQPSLYGNQRLWGSIGWGLFSIFAGLMVDAFSTNDIVKDYTSVFLLMLAMMLLDVLTSCQLKCGQQKISSSLIKDIGRLISRFRIMVYMVWCILMGMATALLWQFLFWHLEELARNYEGTETITWMKTLEGLVMGIQCLGGELPFFFLSGWILRRLGHIHCMTLVLLGVGIRFMLYSVLVNPWWVLPIELMNGVTFGLFYATMASYASIVAPPGAEATIQGLVGAVFEGVGVSLGSLTGGVFMDKYGGAITFRIFSISAFICCILHFIIQLIMEKRSSQKNQDFDACATTRYAPPGEAIRIFEEDQQQLSLVDH